MDFDTRSAPSSPTKGELPGFIQMGGFSPTSKARAPFTPTRKHDHNLQQPKDSPGTPRSPKKPGLGGLGIGLGRAPGAPTGSENRIPSSLVFDPAEDAPVQQVIRSKISPLSPGSPKSKPRKVNLQAQMRSTPDVDRVFCGRDSPGPGLFNYAAHKQRVGSPRPLSWVGSAGSSTSSAERSSESVLVCLRVKPVNEDSPSTWNIDYASNEISDKALNFNFDSIVTGSDNVIVYRAAGKSVVQASMEGFDSVILAYGQTASGKTFTLSGSAHNPGIIPQAVLDIFSYIRNHPNKEFLLRASYLEIYNETLKDLLNPEAGSLRIRQDENHRFFVSPLREEVVTCEDQVAQLLKRGERNRHVGKTDFNNNSSRSHSIFSITIESRDEPDTFGWENNGNGAIKISRLNLVDLAGSEKATSQQERKTEGAFINKSLLTLEKVIASLTESSKKKLHIPYRDSKLTQVLHSSLSGEAQVSVIATINPSPAFVEETRSTLRFAQRVKKVVLKAKKNEVLDDKALIVQYRSQIETLEAQLRVAQETAASTVISSNVVDIQSQLEEVKALFLRSNNLDKRRGSLLPPRPVSPEKLSSSRRMENSDESWRELYEDQLSDNDLLKAQLLAVQQELAEKKIENEQLKLDIMLHKSSPEEHEKNAKMKELLTENQELKVIVQNQTDLGSFDFQKLKMERLIEKHEAYERKLEGELKKERTRVVMFEKYILEHLSSASPEQPFDSLLAETLADVARTRESDIVVSK